MLRKALVILSGNAVASLLLLARNLIIARMIPVADYGIAASFAMAMAVVEMASAFGLQQQIVQSKRGDDPHFQAALQGFQALRGAFSSVVLFLLAGPIARFLNIPEVIWAYQLLAVIPLLNGFQHFDIHRQTRQMRFGPLILTGTVPAFLTLLAAWPLAHLFGDWRVMLYALLGQSVLEMLISHLAANRAYRAVFDPVIIRQSLAFGWPLLLNAGLMFLIFQGDKLIVGRVLGMEALAIFAMGMTLTLTPTLVFAKTAQNLFLPRLSQSANTPDFALVALQTIQVVALAAVVFAFSVLLIGGPAVGFLLGSKYAALAPLLIWFALGQSLRVLKAGPAIVALAVGHTSNAMIANSVRGVSLPLAWLVAVNGGGLQNILFITLAGEGLGFVISTSLMLYRTRLPKGRVAGQQLVVVSTLVATGLWACLAPGSTGVAAWPVWIACGIGLMFVVMVMPETWRKLR